MVSEADRQHDYSGATITSIMSKIGYTPETPRSWIR